MGVRLQNLLLQEEQGAFVPRFLADLDYRLPSLVSELLVAYVALLVVHNKLGEAGVERGGGGKEGMGSDRTLFRRSLVVCQSYEEGSSSPWKIGYISYCLVPFCLVSESTFFKVLVSSSYGTIKKCTATTHSSKPASWARFLACDAAHKQDSKRTILMERKILMERTILMEVYKRSTY